jgi:hypothetical protein
MVYLVGFVVLLRVGCRKRELSAKVGTAGVKADTGLD